MTKRLIDAEELLSAFEKEQYFQLSNKDIKDIINSAPTVDAVEVVRCKDCKYCRETNYTSKPICLKRPTGDKFCDYDTTDYDNFCFNGEKKAREYDRQGITCKS